MKRRKKFDCVEMKDRIQAEMLAEQARDGEAAANDRHRRWLETSDDPLAVWWRKVGARKAGADPAAPKG